MIYITVLYTNITVFECSPEKTDNIYVNLNI
jgi:hypothetical protein